MEKYTETSMSCAAFGRKHGVSKTTVQRWKADGYLVMAGSRVDVARSEELLRGRSAVSKGGTCKGPTADCNRLTYWIDLYTREGETEGGEWAIVCRNIVVGLRRLPAYASDTDVERLAERIAGV